MRSSTWQRSSAIRPAPPARTSASRGMVDARRLESPGFRAKIDLDDGIKELVKILRVMTTFGPLRDA